MKIHSMHGCSCWNWPLAHNKATRDVMRKSIDRSGHCEGCSKQEASVLAEKLFGEAPVKDSSKVCCYNCAGQGKHVDEDAHASRFEECSICEGSGQVFDYERGAARGLATKRHDQTSHSACRKWGAQYRELQRQARLKWDRRRKGCLNLHKASTTEHALWERVNHERERRDGWSG